MKLPTPALASSPAEAWHTTFDRQGYLCPLPALTPEQTQHYLARYHDFNARHQAQLAALKASAKASVTSEMHFAFKWVYELVTQPRILDAVERVLGPNLLVWNTNWFTKQPGDKMFVSWHQDGAYWRLAPMKVATAWVALTPSTPANGCMRVVPGTHTEPNMPQRETYADDNMLSRGQEVAVTVDEARAVDLVLEPGQMSLHHLWIVHGSNANLSKVPRIGLAIRYLATEVEQDSPSRPIAMLARGRDTHGHFELVEPPTSDQGLAGQGRHAEIIQRIRRTFMQGAQAQ